MPLRAEYEEIILKITGIQVRPGLKLLRMSDTTFDFYVDGTDRYVVHFKNPSVFGKEFAVLQAGSNSFTLLGPPTVSTLCYVWSQAELANIVAEAEQPSGPQPLSRMTARTPTSATPMTKPILIPPGR